MAEKSSFVVKKSSFKGKNIVLSFLVKSSFPQNAQKSLLLIFHTAFELNKFEKWPHPVKPNTKMHFHVSLGYHGLYVP